MLYISGRHPQGRGCTAAWRQEVERRSESKPRAYRAYLLRA